MYVVSVCVSRVGFLMLCVIVSVFWVLFRWLVMLVMVFIRVWLVSVCVYNLGLVFVGCVLWLVRVVVN